jgi:hypothetical protein
VVDSTGRLTVSELKKITDGLLFDTIADPGTWHEAASL